MRRSLIVLLTLVAVPAAAFEYAGWQKGPWEQVDDENGITVYRNDEVNGVRAYRADVLIDADADTVMKEVLNHQRAAARSFVQKCDVLHDDGQTTRVYQQIKRAGLGTREFTTAGKIFSPKDPKKARGFSFRMVDGPDDPDIDEVAALDGSFVLRPVSANQTRVSYRMHMDPGTWIPDFVLQRALRNGAVEVVELLRRDAEGPK